MRQQRIWILVGVIGVVVAALGWLTWPVGAQSAEITPISRAAEWMVTTYQNDDGGYTDFSQGANLAESGVQGTLDAILALVSAGVSVSEPVFGESAAPLAYLQAHADALSAYTDRDGGAAGKAALALAAAGQDPRAFGGVDYGLKITGQLSPTGQYRVTGPFGQALAILGLRAAGESASPEAVQWLLDQQAREGEAAGSWDDGFGVVGNADATALAVMALAGQDDAAATAAVAAALDFLARSKTAEGGWSYGPGQALNVNSTALVIQGLTAAGVEVDSAETPYATNGLSPLTVLRTVQTPAGGFQSDLGNGPVDDFFTTAQAIPALAGQSLPVLPPLIAPEPTEAAPEPTPTVTAAETTAAGTTRTFILAVVSLLLLGAAVAFVGSRLGRRRK